jgi:hypothetical protein
MLERLAKATDELEVPVDGAALLAVMALRDELDASIAVAVGGFDAHGLLDVDAATAEPEHGGRSCDLNRTNGE